MKADQKIETQVMAIVNGFFAAYEKRDIDIVLPYFAQDEDLVVLGPAPDERLRGWVSGALNPKEVREQIKRDWARTEGSSIDITWSRVSSLGAVAWIAARVIYSWKSDGNQNSINGRFTAVLEERSNRWVFLQVHFSFPFETRAPGV